jgi:hypothetical protein
MAKRSKDIVRVTKSRAALRLRQLLDELRVLMGAFPDLHDAFDADELPLAFILKRDSRLAEAEVRRHDPFLARPQERAGRRAAVSPARGGQRKQTSDE